MKPMAIKTACLIAGMALLTTPALAETPPPSAPAPQVQPTAQHTTLEVVFVKDIANRGMAFLADGAVTLDQRKADFRQLLRNNFDMQAIAQFAVGIYWKTMSDAQKQTYLQAFEDYTVNIYSKRFQDYKGQALEFKDKTITVGRDVIVSSTLVPKSGEKIAINWRVRSKDGQYKIIDIVVAGVSMSITQRSDFSSIIQRGGGNVEVLLKQLADKNTKNP